MNLLTRASLLALAKSIYYYFWYEKGIDMGNQTKTKQKQKNFPKMRLQPIQTSPRDPPMLWFVYLGFGWGKHRNCGFIGGCFCKNFHEAFTAE